MKERELKCLYVNFEHVAEYDQVRRQRANREPGCCRLLCPGSSLTVPAYCGQLKGAMRFCGHESFMHGVIPCTEMG